MAISNQNSVEENLPMTSNDLTTIHKQIDMFTTLENNRTNLLNDTPYVVAVKNRGSSGNCVYKACHLISLIILSVGISVVCSTLIIIYSPLLKKGSSTNSTPNIYQLAKDAQEERYLSSPTSRETTPGILVFLDRKELKDHKKQAYDVAWELGIQGFVQGNIRFNRSNIYIAKSGTYMISTFLQMEIKQFDKGTFCNLVLNTSKEQNAIYNKYNVPKSVSLPYRFTMSLTLVHKLEEGQQIYISVSPRNYLSDNENSSFLSIYMI